MNWSTEPRALFIRKRTLELTAKSHSVTIIMRLSQRFSLLINNPLSNVVIPSLCRQQANEQGAIIRPVIQPEIHCRVGVICQPRSNLSIAAAAMLDVLIDTYA